MRGSLWYASGTHAQAINDRWAFKLSAGGYSQDPLSRPTGTIPGSPPPGTRIPRSGTAARLSRSSTAGVDYDYRGRTRSSPSRAASPGPTASCTRASGRSTSTAARRWGTAGSASSGRRSAWPGSCSSLDGDATNLIARDPDGRVHPVRVQDEHDGRGVVEREGVCHAPRRHATAATCGTTRSISRLRRGATTARSSASTPRTRSSSRITSAGRSARGWTASTTWTDLVFSPRTALLIKPQENHTFRLSYNRAYRSPSVINNFLDVTLTEPLPLGLINPAFADPRLSDPDPARGQREPHRDVARRVRSRLYGRRGRPDRALGGVLREQVEERHLLHGKPSTSAGRRRTRRPVGPPSLFRRRSSRSSASRASRPPSRTRISARRRRRGSSSAWTRR